MSCSNLVSFRVAKRYGTLDPPILHYKFFVVQQSKLSLDRSSFLSLFRSFLLLSFFTLTSLPSITLSSFLVIPLPFSSCLSLSHHYFPFFFHSLYICLFLLPLSFFSLLSLYLHLSILLILSFLFFSIHFSPVSLPFASFLCIFLPFFNSLP